MCFVKSASILIETGCYLNGMNTRCTLLVCDFRETDILCFMTVVIYFMGLPSWLSGRESNVVDSLASFLVSLSLHFIFLVFNLIKKKNHFWPCKTLMVSSLMAGSSFAEIRFNLDIILIFNIICQIYLSKNQTQKLVNT